MYMRYYDSYPALTGRQQQKNEEPKIEVAQDIEPDEIIKVQEESIANIAAKGGILQSLKTDDIILIALLFLLLTESDDIIMLLIVGFLLLGDKLPI